MAEYRVVFPRILAVGITIPWKVAEVYALEKG